MSRTISMTHRLKPFYYARINCTVVIEKTKAKLTIECERVEIAQKMVDSFLSEVGNFVGIPFSGFSTKSNWVWAITENGNQQFGDTPVSIFLGGEGFTIDCSRVLTIQRRELLNDFKFLDRQGKVASFSFDESDPENYFKHVVKCVTPNGYRLAKLRCHQNVAKEAVRALGALVHEKTSTSGWVDTDMIATYTTPFPKNKLDLLEIQTIV